ncbi:response regulator transcription factor [Baekduia soli]|uniref:Response regulator transcription factor n=1 Tax=Baekduia soli TaxID=496014 RepID=A0A5B8UBU0_9ACTN|nr:response regulator transcription factor [Baekduia soli]QEC50102.1 response regulator transcription factor [Baekduia soli]
MSAVRVLLCDDAAELRALLRWVFERGEDAEIVGEAGTSDAALDLTADLDPDVIVLDLQMPSLSPAELLRAMADIAPGTPIVTFSGFEPELVARAQARLVTLHIPKTTDLELVREAVVEVGRRRA